MSQKDGRAGLSTAWYPGVWINLGYATIGAQVVKWGRAVSTHLLPSKAIEL